MMGCFSTSKPEKYRSASVPRSGPLRSVISSKDSLSLLSNKPVELPDPGSIIRLHSFGNSENEHWSTSVAKAAVTRSRFSDELPSLSDHRKSRTQTLKLAEEGRTAFSGPLVSSAAHNEAMGKSRLLPNYESSHEAKSNSCGLRTLRRTTSFGGRPQPLPLPVTEEAPPKAKQEVCLPLPAPEDATRSRRIRSFKLEDGPGSWSARRGRVASVGGLPLPPPSVASKLLPSLAAVEFSDLVLATDDFAGSFCVAKGAFGDVYRARIQDLSGETHGKIDVGVLRLADNAAQGALEWKSEVQLLAQISNANVCVVKGYCTHEAGPRLSTRVRRQERLLVFEQPSNGSLSDHLFGSRGKSWLDWTSRVNIALGAARGLLYIHNRAPLQIVYKEFTASNVLLDKNYVPKLAGYGLSVTVSPVHRSSSFTTSLMVSQGNAKSNIWSFGILLLELLTGKNSRDAIYFGDDSNFVQWGRQFMREESRLSHIIDPRMKGACPIKGAMEWVALLLQCVSKREAQWPSMSEIVGTLKTIKANYCSNPEASWVLSPRKPERLSQDTHIFTDMQTSSDASSSENDDVSMPKISSRALRVRPN